MLEISPRRLDNGGKYFYRRRYHSNEKNICEVTYMSHAKFWLSVFLIRFVRGKYKGFNHVLSQWKLIRFLSSNREEITVVKFVLTKYKMVSLLEPGRKKYEFVWYLR